MANWDHLHVECKNAEVIKGLVDGSLINNGFDRYLLDQEVYIGNPNKCFMRVLYGVKWKQAFCEFSKQFNEVFRVQATYDHEQFQFHYFYVFKDGDYYLEDEKDIYTTDPEELGYNFIPLDLSKNKLKS